LQVLNVKRKEYFDKGYHGAVARIDELSNYVRSLGSSSMPGGIKAEERMMRLTCLEYEARFRNYNAIGEIEAMAMDTEEDTTVRLKAVQTLGKIRSDTLLDPEKVPAYSIMWATVLQDKEIAKKYSDILEDARTKNDARAQSFIAIINNKMENAVFEYAKKNYQKHTDEEGKQITTETISAILMQIKDEIKAYQKGQTGATGTVKWFDNIGDSLRSLITIPENKAVDFVNINQTGFESASIAVSNAIIELADRGVNVVNGKYVGIVDSNINEKRLLYVTQKGEVYEIKPDGAKAKAERIINPEDPAIPALNSLLKNNDKGLPKEIEIDIIQKEKVKDKKDKTIMSYLPEGYTANEGSVVYRTNYDNVYIYDHVSKSGSQGKFFRVFVEVKNPGSKGKIIKAIDMSKGM